MSSSIAILIFEALFVYLLVLGSHALRHRYGLAHFYALLGGITAIMAWVTDAGVAVELAGITFMVGSTVFYTALILGTFVIYAFDGPARARVAISTVLGVSILTPLVAFVLHWQASSTGSAGLPFIPAPNLRVNAASAFTTFVDLLFLGIAWELLGKTRLKLGLWLRTYLTLLGVLMLDVLLFNTTAFLGSSNYLPIMTGTLVSRLIISVFSLPVLYGYLRWQTAQAGVTLENRPVLAILRKYSEMKAELTQAQQEIGRRIAAEQERAQAMSQLEQSREQYRLLSEKYEKASKTDELTGIPNRRFFNERLEMEWKRAVRERTMLSVMLIDVDGFKEYNDSNGHLAGDQALAQLAELLQRDFRRPGDLLARLGGDEFAAILPRTDSAGAATVANNCFKRLLREREADRSVLGSLSVSIGITDEAPQLGMDRDDLLKRADSALYQAKRSGGARFVIAPEVKLPDETK